MGAKKRSKASQKAPAVEIVSSKPAWRFGMTADQKHSLGVLACRVAAVFVVASICLVTIIYSTRVYFDVHGASRDMYRCVSESLSNLGWEHWLDDGSLLGAMRLGSFVVWDGSIDLGVLVDKPGALQSVIADIESACSLYSSTVMHTIRSPKEWSLWNSHFQLNIQEWMPNGSQLDGVLSSFSMDWIFPLQSCDVGPLKALCPSNSSAVLAHRFGEYWQNSSLMELFMK
jgi:hypothetical protein